MRENENGEQNEIKKKTKNKKKFNKINDNRPRRVNILLHITKSGKQCFWQIMNNIINATRNVPFLSLHTNTHSFYSIHICMYVAVYKTSSVVKCAVGHKIG